MSTFWVSMAAEQSYYSLSMTLRIAEDRRKAREGADRARVTSLRLHPRERLSPTGIPSGGPHRSPAALSLAQAFETPPREPAQLPPPPSLGWAVLRVSPGVLRGAATGAQLSQPREGYECEEYPPNCRPLEKQKRAELRRRGSRSSKSTRRRSSRSRSGSPSSPNHLALAPPPLRLATSKAPPKSQPTIAK